MTASTLVSGCISRHYEKTEPNKRYQASERRGKSELEKDFTKTFSTLAPQGDWSFRGSNRFGELRFIGAPSGAPRRYAGYEVKMILESGDIRAKERDLRALKSGDFNALVDDIISDEKAFYGRLNLKGNDAGYPMPRKYSARLASYRGMSCTIYESEKHIFIASNNASNLPAGAQGKGDGAEQYGIGYFCPGFHNGVQARFGYGVTIMVNNKHVIDGIDIDSESLKEEIFLRMQRAMDSVQFNGEFTQELPQLTRRSSKTI